jgi:DNA-binding PadR family transcriptional regulator
MVINDYSFCDYANYDTVCRAEPRMEKKLLLLGLLLSHDMHGYQLYDAVQHYAGVAITLTKSNAYKLLNDMEADGWVTHQEEQAGKRPPRRVYSVTDEGKAAFHRLLRHNLSSFPPPEFPGVVGLDFLPWLPTAEAVTLLETRLHAVEAKFQHLNELSEEIRQRHVAVEYLHRYYAGEIEWLTEVITRLQSTSVLT